MNRRTYIWIAILVCAAAAAVFVVQSRRSRHALPHHSVGTALVDRMGLPNVVFWAWERPEDLRFLDPQKAGVAFLARTIYLTPPDSSSEDDPDPGVVVRPRMQPLQVVPGEPLMAVVRIETRSAKTEDAAAKNAANPSPSSGQIYNAVQRNRIATLVSEAALLPGVRALQIDFDAASSQQKFYRELLIDIRPMMPRGMPLSITALASWCVGDSWLDGLPTGAVDEAVPMLFRMGTGGRNFAAFLKTGQDFSVSLCRGSLGVGSDEAFSEQVLRGSLRLSSQWRARRIYIFPPRPLSENDAGVLFDALKLWHEELPIPQ